MTHEQRLIRGDTFAGYGFKVGGMYVSRDDVSRLTTSRAAAMRRHTFGDALKVKNTIVGVRFPTMRVVSFWRRAEKGR